MATQKIKWKSPKTWREKLEREHPSHGKVVDVPSKMQKRFGGKMLIPQPLDVDGLIRKVKKGRLVSVNQIRERLARDAHADSSCPLTTGIFIRIAAETAEEDGRAGRKDITPYWRVVKSDGGLNEKFPGGIAGQGRHLKEEGFDIEKGKGKKPAKVKDFEKYLVRL